jgi:hypothetical protein
MTMQQHASRFVQVHRDDCTGLVLVALVGAIIYGWVASYNVTVTGFTDAMEYLFMADFYREALLGNGAGEAAAHYRTTRFPPVFPLILAIFGAGTDEQHAANIVACTIAVLAALSVWWWVRIDRDSSLAATMVAVGLLLYPMYFLINLFPVSEPLSILLLACCFALLSTPQPSRSRVLAAACIVGIAPLARTATLPLLVAFIIWLGLTRQHSLRQMALPLSAAFAPLLVWLAYRSTLSSDSYLEHLTLELMVKELGGWPNALWVQPQRLFLAAVDNWAGNTSTWISITVTAVISLLAATGCAIRLLRNRLDAWFLAGYVAMILIWPYPYELGRFLVVVYPMILLCCLTSLDSLREAAIRWRRWDVGGSGHAALVLLVMAASASTILVFSQRAMLPVDDALLGDKREPIFFRIDSDKNALWAADVYARMRNLAAVAGKQVPEGECVYSTIPQLLQLHGSLRSVLYPLGLEGTESAEDELQDCNYFVIVAMVAAQLDLRELYPWQSLVGWTDMLLKSEFELDGESGLAAALLVRSKKLHPDLPED